MSVQVLHAAGLRIIQTMKSILEQPASHELKVFIDQQLTKETDQRMVGFLRLLVTDNEANRARARQVFQYLERQLHEKQTDVAARPTDHVGSTQPETEAIAAPVARALPPGSASELGMASLLGAPTSTAPAKQVHSIPYKDPLDELETITYNQLADGTVKAYSIITADTTPEQLAGAHITRVVAAVIGVEGQKIVEHGFGFVLPIPIEGGINLDHSLKERCQMKLAMGYPGAIGIYDDHAGPHIGGISNFMALHESMSDGYKFLLDLEIIPINGRFSLSIKPQQLIERYCDVGEGPVLDRVCSVHMRKLLFACEKIGFIGFLGEVEVS